MCFRLDEIEILRGYLNLPNTELVPLQKQAALELGDNVRAVRMSIKEKDMFFERSDRRSQFERRMYPGLKPEEEWGKRGIGKLKLLHFVRPLTCYQPVPSLIIAINPYYI